MLKHYHRLYEVFWTSSNEFNQPYTFVSIQGSKPMKKPPSICKSFPCKWVYDIVYKRSLPYLVSYINVSTEFLHFGHDSSVGIATRYNLDVTPPPPPPFGKKYFLFCISISTPVLGPTQPSPQQVPGLLAGSKLAGASRWPLAPI